MRATQKAAKRLLKLVLRLPHHPDSLAVIEGELHRVRAYLATVPKDQCLVINDKWYKAFMREKYLTGFLTQLRDYVPK